MAAIPKMINAAFCFFVCIAVVENEDIMEEKYQISLLEILHEWHVIFLLYENTFMDGLGLRGTWAKAFTS